MFHRMYLEKKAFLIRRAGVFPALLGIEGLSVPLPRHSKWVIGKDYSSSFDVDDDLRDEGKVFLRVPLSEVMECTDVSNNTL